MNKPQKLIVGFFVLCVLVIALLWGFLLYQQSNTLTNTLYYSLTCPHCKIVEAFITDNNITLKFEQKEVSTNPLNAAELINAGKICKLDPQYQGSIPLLVYNQTCYLGDVDIINFLNKTQATLA